MREARLSLSAVRIEEIRCVIEAIRKRRADCGSVERAVCSVVDVVEGDPADVSQLGELKRVRRAETSPPTLSTVPGRWSAGRAEASPSGGNESADVVDRAGSWASRES